MEFLSAYVLTHNSEHYLEQILAKLSIVADEILVVDSGSSDKTAAIAGKFPLARLVYHAFCNFKEQRSFAAKACQYDMVLFLDSDEIPNDKFISQLQQLKEKGFAKEAYQVERHWNVLGKSVGVFYPIVSPDFPIRLYNKKKVSFQDSSLVHETPSGYSSKAVLEGSIAHYTFENLEILNQKLDFYTNIAAEDLLLKGKNIGFFKALSSPIAAFIKWYLVKGGFRDGKTGWVLGCYAYRYTRLKYLKAKKLAG